jgi:hypothetical protein
MKRFNSYQIAILEKIEAGAELRRDGDGWYFVWDQDRVGDRKMRIVADGRACPGMIRKSPQWITFGPFDDGRPEPRCPVGYAKLTDAGCAALAEAREG